MTHCLQLQGLYCYFICCACENSAQVINSSLNLPSLFPAFPPHSCLFTTLHREARRPFSIALFLRGTLAKVGVEDQWICGSHLKKTCGEFSHPVELYFYQISYFSFFSFGSDKADLDKQMGLYT